MSRMHNSKDFSIIIKKPLLSTELNFEGNDKTALGYFSGRATKSQG